MRVHIIVTIDWSCNHFAALPRFFCCLDQSRIHWRSLRGWWASHRDAHTGRAEAVSGHTLAFAATGGIRADDRKVRCREDTRSAGSSEMPDLTLSWGTKRCFRPL